MTPQPVRHPGSGPGMAIGFTLLEMLIAVTVLGILMTMAQAAWWQHVARVRRTGSPQQVDDRCREFWLDQTGARGSSPAPPSICWN
jgi:prepilin-type N-terminal cleavage/methylation domain-containing protein